MKNMSTKNLSIPSTFTSTFFFSTLIAFFLFSFLYIHPRDANNNASIPRINTENTRLILNNTFVNLTTTYNSSNIRDELSTGALVNLTRPGHNNVSYGQVSDSTILKARLNLTSNEPPQNIVEKTPINKQERKDDEDIDKDEDYDIIPSFDVFSNPPWNCTRKERINWLKEKLVESKILKSTIRTRNFHGKIQAFLNNSSNGNDTNCDVTFYFTWISPAS